MPETAAVRTVSPSASAVLEHLAARKQNTISLPGDISWLEKISAGYPQLLDAMEEQQTLYRVLRGNYVVAPRGTDAADQAAPIDSLVDLVFRDRAPYYIGFFSAFIRWGLTDLHSDVVYVAIPASAGTDLSEFDLAGAKVQVVRLSPTNWPADADEIVRERAISGTREFVRRSGLARTLVDGLLRPDLCGGIETVLSGLGRASRLREFDPDAVWHIARTMGPGMAKRTAFLLREIGHGDTVEPDLPALRKRRSKALLDRFQRDTASVTPQRDPATGVTVNVPARALRGWLAEELG